MATNTEERKFSDLVKKTLFVIYAKKMDKELIHESLWSLKFFYYCKENRNTNDIYNLFDCLVTIPVNEKRLFYLSCEVISKIMEKQKPILPQRLFNKLIDWMCECTDIKLLLSTLEILFKCHPSYCIQYWDKLIPQYTSLMEIYISDKNDSIRIMSVLKNLLSYTDELKNCITNEHKKILGKLGDSILDIIFSMKLYDKDQLINALKILYKIANENKKWTEENADKILGIATSYMNISYNCNLLKLKPQKICISQQSLLDSTEESLLQIKNGKIQKTRKLTVYKNKSDDKNIKDLRINFGVDYDENFYNLKCYPFIFSDDEIKILSISLIAVVEKILDKNILYGYWHAFFPTDLKSAGLLNNILKESDKSIKILAVQTTSMLLFGSKSYLIQAENSDKSPKSFTPFSISLGNMVLVMYEVLTRQLAELKCHKKRLITVGRRRKRKCLTRARKPVTLLLVQVLKCLSVLIQATPFHRLRTGFVKEFVKHIKEIIFSSYKGATIQVAALTVMEFLINVEPSTPEISECIDSSLSSLMTSRQNQKHLNDSGIEEVIETEELDEEYLDSDYEDIINTEIIQLTNDNNDNDNNDNNSPPPKMSWLLSKVLTNLRFKKCSLPVRTQSLKVLTSMALHFLIIKDYLETISTVLKSTLNDSQAEIRLHTSKCLDAIGHSINIYLLEKGECKNFDNELMICKNFWTNILPVTIKKIQDRKQTSVLKANLCDFLSNICVHVFERLPHNIKMQIICLLSGIGYNEEITVRASAVRALAVYVVFPSLREDLCFIENTAELCIQLMKDTNLLTRIKASWSMGNISDALILNSNNSRLDRISDNLLKQMLEVSINAANDNDKVRCNAVRIIGNLLRLINDQHLKYDEWKKLCMKSIEKLSYCTNSRGNAKVKWNSCYAIGNFMKNKLLFSKTLHDDDILNWQKIIFPSLCNLIVKNSNFKVRINGAAALCSIENRENYDTYMNLIWSSLLLAIEQSDNLNDFNEYNHRDNLQEQLCLTLSHIIKIAKPNDFSQFKIELVPKLEAVKHIWTRVINRILPESVAALISCTIKLENLLSSNDENLTSEQKNSIQIIASCLTRGDQEEFFT